jgi:hypothetical protein
LLFMDSQRTIRTGTRWQGRSHKEAANVSTTDFEARDLVVEL